MGKPKIKTTADGLMYLILSQTQALRPHPQREPALFAMGERLVIERLVPYAWTEAAAEAFFRRAGNAKLQAQGLIALIDDVVLGAAAARRVMAKSSYPHDRRSTPVEIVGRDEELS